jgi:glutamate 5-kinase
VIWQHNKRLPRWGKVYSLHTTGEKFKAHNVISSQVLLTTEDVVRRSHYANAQQTLTKLLSLGVVPIINENDTVGTQEIRFGDNDRLAALVALLIG